MNTLKPQEGGRFCIVKRYINYQRSQSKKIQHIKAQKGEVIKSSRKPRRGDNKYEEYKLDEGEVVLVDNLTDYQQSILKEKQDLEAQNKYGRDKEGHLQRLKEDDELLDDGFGDLDSETAHELDGYVSDEVKQKRLQELELKLDRLGMSQVNDLKQQGDQDAGIRSFQQERQQEINQNNVQQLNRQRSNQLNLGQQQVQVQDDDVGIQRIDQASKFQQQLAQQQKISMQLEKSRSQSNIKIYDKLMAMFLQRPQTQWKNLIANSSKWEQIHEGFFLRMDEVARTTQDANYKMRVIQAQRLIRDLHTTLFVYDKIIEEFDETDDIEWDGLIFKFRSKMDQSFFAYFKDKFDYPVSKSDDIKLQQEQQKYLEMAAKILVLVEGYDKAIKDEDKLVKAQKSFSYILDSGVQSRDEMERRIDKLSDENKIDESLLLLITKAYQGVKDLGHISQEVKDVMRFIYLSAKAAIKDVQPPEFKILKYILSLEEPSQVSYAVDEAFIQDRGLDQIADGLYTNPEQLIKAIQTVLHAYNQHKGKNSLLKGLENVKSPEAIQKLQSLQGFIYRKYM